LFGGRFNYLDQLNIKDTLHTCIYQIVLHAMILCT